MDKFWTYGDFVSWKGCIEANKICNLRECPDTMNCCVTNCVGMPTIKGIVLMLSITIIVMFFIWIFKIINTANKIEMEKEK